MRDSVEVPLVAAIEVNASRQVAAHGDLPREAHANVMTRSYLLNILHTYAWRMARILMCAFGGPQKKHLVADKSAAERSASA